MQGGDWGFEVDRRNQGEGKCFLCVLKGLGGLGVPSENSVNFWSHRALGEGALK